MVVAHVGVWWYGGGILAFFWLVLLLTLGLISIMKGHWVMFLLGIFLPLFWFIGALMPSKRG